MPYIDNRRKAYLYESNLLLKHIGQCNVSLTQLAEVLDLNYATCKKWTKQPIKYLTVSHANLIAGITNTPLLYIIGLIYGFNKKNADKWYKDQIESVNFKFMLNLPTNDKPGT